jgi:hypothetical protein
MSKTAGAFKSVNSTVSNGIAISDKSYSKLFSKICTGSIGKNGKKSDARFGTGATSPLEYNGYLKRYGTEPYYIGTTTSVGIDEVNRWFKGDIAKVMMWDRCLSENEI